MLIDDFEKWQHCIFNKNCLGETRRSQMDSKQIMQKRKEKKRKTTGSTNQKIVIIEFTRFSATQCTNKWIDLE